MKINEYSKGMRFLTSDQGDYSPNAPDIFVQEKPDYRMPSLELGFEDGGRVGFSIGGFLNDNQKIKTKVIADLKNPKIELQAISNYIKSQGYNKISAKSFSNFVNNNEEYNKIKNKPKGGVKGDPSNPARQATQKQKKYNEIKKIIDEAVESGDINILKSKTRGTGGKLTMNQANILAEALRDSKKFDEMSDYTGISKKNLRSILNQRKENIDDIKANIPIKQKLATPSIKLQERLLSEMFRGPSSVEKISALLNKPIEEIQEGFSKLYRNIYAERVAIGKGKYATKGKSIFIPRDDQIIDQVLKNMNNTKGLRKQQQYAFSELLYNAFGRKNLEGTTKPNPTFNRAKYTKAMANYDVYNKKIKKVFDTFGVQLDLDHPLSKGAITKANLPADKLVRVTPISSGLNRGLKESFDAALIKNPENRQNIRNLANELGIKIGTIGEGGGVRYGVKSFEKFTPDELAQTALTNLANEEAIATKLKNVNPNLLEKAGMKNLKAPKVNTKSFKSIAETLRKAGFKCKFAGSKGGIGSCDDPRSYFDDIKIQTELAKKGQPAAVNKFNNAGKIAKKSKGFLKATGFGILAEAGFEGAFVLNDVLSGVPVKEAFQKSLFGLIPGVGTSKDAEASKMKRIVGNDPRSGQYVKDLANINELQSVYKDYLRKDEDVVDAYTQDEKFMAEKKLTDLLETFDNKAYDRVKFGTPEFEAFQAKEEVEDVNQLKRAMGIDPYLFDRTAQRANTSSSDIESKQIGRGKYDEDMQGLYYGYGGVDKYAGGGLAKLAGKRSGTPPESGPTPQGLDYLLKRGRQY